MAYDAPPATTQDNRFVKTNGHALENPSFLQRFPELREEALGNDQADKAARHAKPICFQPNVVRLSDILAERTADYTIFMKHCILLSVGCMRPPKPCAKRPLLL